MTTMITFRSLQWKFVYIYILKNYNIINICLLHCSTRRKNDNKVDFKCMSTD